jgi:hypothetical protein
MSCTSRSPLVETTKATNIDSGDHYLINPMPWQIEGAFTLGSNPEVEATIASLKQHCEIIRKGELKHMRGRLGHLNSTQEDAIQSLTLAIVDHILDAPVSALKAASEDNDSRAVIETVHHIFSLDERPPGMPLRRIDVFPIKPGQSL